VPPASSIWIPVRRLAPASRGHPAGRTPAGGHARVRRGGAGYRGPGRQGAGGCGRPERPFPNSGITLSDEGGQEERALSRSVLPRCPSYWLAVTRGSGQSVAPIPIPIPLALAAGPGIGPPG